MKYEKLKTKDIVFVNMKGEFNKSKNKPSSEWKFHKDIYKNRNESKAIVHCHSKMPWFFLAFERRYLHFITWSL